MNQPVMSTFSTPLDTETSSFALHDKRYYMARVKQNLESRLNPNRRDSCYKRRHPGQHSSLNSFFQHIFHFFKHTEVVQSWLGEYWRVIQAYVPFISIVIASTIIRSRSIGPNKFDRLTFEKYQLTTRQDFTRPSRTSSHRRLSEKANF